MNGIANDARAFVGAESHPGAAGRKRRILIVDDNHDTADSLAILLELAGHDVRKAYEGHAAVGVAAEFRPDTVLLDIGLPGLDGYQVARRIREEAQRPVLLIGISGWVQARDRELAREAGFDHYLLKPASIEALEDLLTRPRA